MPLVQTYKEVLNADASQVDFSAIQARHICTRTGSRIGTSVAISVP
jgi:hypothetical protein